MTIFFYTKTDPYFEFSNFAPYGVLMNNVWWPTVEHYFQAQKFSDAAYVERIQKAVSPKQAAQLGRSRGVALREDWEEVKDSIMLGAVQKKFETHPALRELLLSTGEKRIVENAPSDYYWGCGSDGSGLNRLGEILMRVREQLRV